MKISPLSTGFFSLRPGEGVRFGTVTVSDKQQFQKLTRGCKLDVEEWRPDSSCTTQDDADSNFGRIVNGRHGEHNFLRHIVKQ